jgi:CTP:molybdopterin cytidylyltransferase MocA
VSAILGAIVLAAGASRRLGQPKQLLMYGGETLLERAIRLANEAGAAPVVMVLGAYQEQIRRALRLNNASLAINDHWEQGIASSIHAGLAAQDSVGPDAEGTLILSCDQPRLTAIHLRNVLETFAAQMEPSIVASAYAGVLGIPAAFPRMVFPGLLALTGDQGARALLLQPPCPLLSVPFPGGELDIDQPDDLRQLE